MHERQHIAFAHLSVATLQAARCMSGAGHDLSFVLKPRNPFEHMVALSLRGKGIRLLDHLDELEGPTTLVVDPPVLPDQHALEALRKRFGDVACEMELAARFFGSPRIGVTGTKGKTTLIAMLSHALSELGLKAHPCGNYPGPTFIDVASRIPSGDIALVEIGSAHLTSVRDFAPDIAVVVNLDIDHLDWHSDPDAYRRAKLRLAQLVGDDGIAVLPDNLAQEWEGSCSARIIGFNPAEAKNTVAYIARHILALLGFAEEPARKALQTYHGMEHRLEELGSANGRVYFNDSHSTTALSVSWALEVLDRQVVLLMGGVSKGGDFRRIGAHVKKYARRVIAFGRDRRKIAAELSAFCEVIHEVETLADAVEVAKGTAQDDTNAAVLLSPGCASFDQFRNADHRGDMFRCLVLGGAT